LKGIKNTKNTRGVVKKRGVSNDINSRTEKRQLKLKEVKKMKLQITPVSEKEAKRLQLFEYATKRNKTEKTRRCSKKK